MRLLLIVLFCAASAVAADSQGQGSNPFVRVPLDDTISLSFFTKPEDDTLYFRLSWRESETSSSSLSSGSGVLPKQRYAYFWDDSAKVFWFADARFLQKFDMSKAKEGSTQTSTCNVTDYRGLKDLPPEMVPLIESLLRHP